MGMGAEVFRESAGHRADGIYTRSILATSLLIDYYRAGNLNSLQEHASDCSLVLTTHFPVQILHLPLEPLVPSGAP